MRRSVSLCLAWVMLVAVAPAQFDGFWFRVAPHFGVNGFAQGDFDGDGDIDLAVADDEFFIRVWIFTNDGFGRFDAPPLAVPTGLNQITGLVAGDLEGDGDQDFLVTCLGSSTCFIVALRNDGGSWAQVFSSQIPAVPSGGIALVDLDNDGDLDLCHGIHQNIATQVGVYLNDGTLHFTHHGNFARGGGVTGTIRQIVTGDFDGDGNQDVATVDGVTTTFGGTFPFFNQQEANSVSILLGDGSGNLTAGATLATGTSPRSAAATDLDGDGNLDLAVAAFGAPPLDDGGLDLFLGDGMGGFAAPVTEASQFHPARVVAGDHDADGDVDLVTLATQFPFSNAVGDRVNYHENTGGAAFAPAVSQSIPFPLNQAAEDILAADLDGDGKSDLGVVAFHNLAAMLVASRTFALFPGSNDDLVLATGVGGAVTSAPPDDVKTVSIGDYVTVCVDSPQGTFNGETVWLVAQLFDPNTPPGPLPGTVDAYINPAVNASLLFATMSLPAGGQCIVRQMPFWASGWNILIQAYGFSQNAANGSYAATDAHHLIVQ